MLAQASGIAGPFAKLSSILVRYRMPVDVRFMVNGRDAMVLYGCYLLLATTLEDLRLPGKYKLRRSLIA